MSFSAGDERVRKRVTTLIAEAGVTATGTYSKSNGDAKFCDRHHISLLVYGAPAGGILRIRARPVNAPSTGSAAADTARPVKIGLEAINVATDLNHSFIINGFFDAFQMSITTAVTGPGAKVVCIINSVQTS